MAHKLQELLHDFANKINAMNNPIAMSALIYLKKDLNSLPDEEKQQILGNLKDIFEKANTSYDEAIKEDDKIIVLLQPHNAGLAVLDKFNDIMDAVHNAGRRNNQLYNKLLDISVDSNYDSNIKSILNKAMEFDKHMPLIAQKLEDIKDILREQGLYPKRNV